MASRSTNRERTLDRFLVSATGGAPPGGQTGQLLPWATRSSGPAEGTFAMNGDRFGYYHEIIRGKTAAMTVRG
jgi:hypothetical protein